MTTHRITRINHLLRREISEIIRREVKDPRIEGITITQVRVSRDLRSAIVMISIIGDEDRRQAGVEALNRAAGFIRRHLLARLDIKIIPTLKFEVDRNVDYSMKIDGLLKGLKGEADES